MYAVQHHIDIGTGDIFVGFSGAWVWQLIWLQCCGEGRVELYLRWFVAWDISFTISVRTVHQEMFRGL